MERIAFIVSKESVQVNASHPHRVHPPLKRRGEMSSKYRTTPSGLFEPTAVVASYSANSSRTTLAPYTPSRSSPLKVVFSSRRRGMTVATIDSDLCFPGLRWPKLFNHLLVAEFDFLLGQSHDRWIETLLVLVHVLRLHSWLLPCQGALGSTTSELARAPQMYNSIPVEIWRQTFAVAVRRCVHAQRLQATAAADDHGPFNLGSPHLLQDTLKIKLALCLVSKGFNSIATEFLYESVHLPPTST